jgi:hypothetical protein
MEQKPTRNPIQKVENHEIKNNLCTLRDYPIIELHARGRTQRNKIFSPNGG